MRLKFEIKNVGGSTVKKIKSKYSSILHKEIVPRDAPT
jgi:hypothetical protein